MHLLGDPRCQNRYAGREHAESSPERKGGVSVQSCTKLEFAARRGLVEGSPECLGGSDGLVDSDLELRGSRAFHLWTNSDVMREAGFSPPLAQPVN